MLAAGLAAPAQNDLAACRALPDDGARLACCDALPLVPTMAFQGTGSGMTGPFTIAAPQMLGLCQR